MRSELARTRKEEKEEEELSLKFFEPFLSMIFINLQIPLGLELRTLFIGSLAKKRNETTTDRLSLSQY